VRRFRAHKAKARQATSRRKMIEKLKVEDVKPSSRQYPFIRFLVDPNEKLHRLALEAKGVTKGYARGKPLFGKLDLTIEAGEKVAVIGPNGIGKTTLLRCLAQNLDADAGTVKWAEKARLGYWPQDPADEFKTGDKRDDESLAEWLSRWRRKDRAQDEQIVRATLGQLLFSGDEQRKPLRVISGGEGQRMLIGKLVLSMPNVMLLDEPTNHLDMEAIESLNTALEKYTGTLVFVSHDREFVSSLATRVIELRPGEAGGPAEVVDFRGSYEDYLAGRTAERAAA
jgi:ATPase subunit of ABC transporter with duplicated ATPase domains